MKFNAINIFLFQNSPPNPSLVWILTIWNVLHSFIQVLEIQWWARPVYAFWDWDRDFWILVSKFETETETFEISLKFWDWDWDFILLVSKLETETETTLVSVSVSRPKSRSSLICVWAAIKTISSPNLLETNIPNIRLSTH